MKQSKEKEGLQALKDYAVAYQNEYGVRNVREAKDMARTGRVEMSLLERLLDEEIWMFESDIKQYRRSGTGWFASRYGTPTPVTTD